MLGLADMCLDGDRRYVGRRRLLVKARCLRPRLEFRVVAGSLGVRERFKRTPPPTPSLTDRLPSIGLCARTNDPVNARQGL